MASNDDISDPSMPWNFSWVIKDKLCACAWPETKGNVEYLKKQNVGHIVSLSADMQPPKLLLNPVSKLKYHLIDVEEFEPPTIPQIQHFISICEEAHSKNRVVCVHCRMGRGRTGVMLACYLVHFHKQVPDQAITNIRLMRPQSIETWPQERIIRTYWDFIAWN